MIRYNLSCEHGHSFDAWFPGSDAFDEQAAQGQISCPFCGTPHVSKAPMAPNISMVRSRRPAQLENNQDQKTVLNMTRRIRDYIETNAEYVGDRFADEARKIHYQESEPRGVYGEATLKEVRDLHEEGIECHHLPQLPEDQN